MNWDWRDDAACATEDPALFFGPDNEPAWQRKSREASALAVCARCPVRRPCLRNAVTTETGDGVWGGLSERKLRKLTRPEPLPVVVTIDRKLCRYCDTEKPAGEFAVDRQHAGGLSSRCLACKKDHREQQKAAA